MGINGCFQFNCSVVSVKYVYEVIELVKCVSPGSYDVIQEAIVKEGFEGAFG